MENKTKWKTNQVGKGDAAEGAAGMGAGARHLPTQSEYFRPHWHRRTHWLEYNVALWGVERILVVIGTGGPAAARYLAEHSFEEVLAAAARTHVAGTFGENTAKVR
eukprot:824478-Prorocentrum_minimum.AAC.1